MKTTAFAALTRRVLAIAAVPCCFLLTESLGRAQNVTFGGSAAGATPAPADAPAPAPAPAPAAAAPADAAATSTGATGGPGAAVETVEANPEWDARDEALGEANTLSGGTGLLRTQHAQSGAPGQFRLGFTTEYFSAGFLCNSTFPCKNPNGGQNLTSDSMEHIGGTISLGVTLTKWLEAYAATGAYANSDASNRPSLLQVLGDTDFGLKAFGALAPWFWVGGGAELWLINGTGAVGLDGSGTGAKFRGIMTADFRGLPSHTPVRISFNGTYSVDNTGDVLTATEAGRGTSVTRIERFGLGVNRVDHVDLSLGAEFFAVEERIRPFMEYSVLLPVNRQNYLCKTNNVSGDNCLATDTLLPSKLTIGSRFYPWKRGFSLLAAFDIGLTGVNDFIEEVSPTPPWTLFIGAGWNVDTWDRPVKVVSKTVEKPTLVAPRGHVKGFVHEKDKNEGIASAIVAFDNHPELTSLATAADGHFNTQELPEGPYKFAIRADGFKDGACETVLKGTADVQLDCPMEALPRVGIVIGHVRDATSQAPVNNASVKLTDPQGKELRATTDPQGSYRMENVPPGAVTMEVEADNYLALVQPAQVKVRQENTVDLLIQPKPKNPLVQVGAKEINIKQQIQFALDSAVILPESFGLMSEIADTLIKNPRIRRIEVQGHTDNSGTPEHNKSLSDQRANAVRDWLTAHGVGTDRLIARGYGQDKPLVPNVTAAMKAKNRRVQFIIMEQDPASALAPAGGTKPSSPF